MPIAIVVIGVVERYAVDLGKRRPLECAEPFSREPGPWTAAPPTGTRAVAGAVVDDDALAFGREVDREEPIDLRRRRSRLIEDGNADRDERSIG